MSIASQLQAYKNGLTDAYNMVSQKGGTMPIHKNMMSLASSIGTIPSGGSFIGIPREVNPNGVYGTPSTGTFNLPSNATDVGNYALNFAFYGSGITSADLSSLTALSNYYSLGSFCYNCSSLTSADLSSLTTVSGSYTLYNAFYNCTSLSSVNLSSLTTVSGSNDFYSAFQSCTRLTSVDLSSLTTVSGDSAFYKAFYNCTSLSSVDLSSLTTVSGGSAFSFAFQSCSNLASVDLSSLTDISGSQALRQAFRYCSNLQTLSFPSLTASSFGTSTNQFQQMLQGVRGCTVHFPEAIQSTIGNWSDVTSGFGGTDTTVLFDL